MKIQIILGSTREHRFGEKVAQWFYDLVKKRTDATYELIDLADWPLKFLYNQEPPMMGVYPDPLVKKWAKKIAEGDGYIIITPEYNHGYPAVLKNALDVIYKEWNNKPVAFVGYGGLAGGGRAVEQLRQVVNELQMASIRETILIPTVWQAFDEQGSLKDESIKQKVESLVNQLLWWTTSLKQAREKS